MISNTSKAWEGLNGECKGQEKNGEDRTPRKALMFGEISHCLICRSNDLHPPSLRTT